MEGLLSTGPTRLVLLRMKYLFDPCPHSAGSCTIQASSLKKKTVEYLELYELLGAYISM